MYLLKYEKFTDQFIQKFDKRYSGIKTLIINYKIIQLKLHEDKYIIELNQIDEKLKEKIC